MRCPYCHARLPVEPERACPSCGARWSEGENDPMVENWHPIARFTYVAEAGYFADVLESMGIPSRVEYRDRISASDGHWQTEYELQVPAANRDMALGVLKRALESDTAKPGQSDRNRESVHALEGTPSGQAWWFDAPRNPWADVMQEKSTASHPPRAKWLLWALLAGTLGYCAGRQPIGWDGPTSGDVVFWRRVAESAPWVSRPHGAIPCSTLRYDASRRVLTIELDQDGDGRFETHWGTLPLREVPRP